jgi:hypothetical protein
MNSGKVLELAALHGGVTVKFLNALYPKKSVKTAEAMIADVRDHFRIIPFDGKRSLYVPNHKGRKATGLPKKKGSESAQAIIFIVVALNLFAANPEMTRFTAEQFERKCPALVVKGINSGRYFFNPGKGLSYPYVDYGSEARRLLKKMRRELARRSGPVWKSTLQSEAFYLTLVTGTKAKAESLQRLFNRNDLPVQVVHDPDLGHLLGVR